MKNESCQTQKMCLHVIVFDWSTELNVKQMKLNGSEIDLQIYTDGSRILHTLLVKHYNDLLYRLSSERDKDEVTYFYVRDVFCIHLGTKYADFQVKKLCGDFWEKVPNFSMKSLEVFTINLREDFFLKTGIL